MTPLPAGQVERRAGPSSAALANSDRLARLIRIVGIALAIYVAIAVTVASIIGVNNSFKAAEHATKAETFARQALDQARVNAGIATDVKDLVAAQSPCLPEDPPSSPACMRRAASEKVVADAIAEILAGIETHDLNVKASLDALLAPRRSRSSTSRVPVTSPPRPAAPRAAPSPPPSPPPATTTTCPTKGRSDRCR